ncbi:hypothetical protein A0H76_691 [Hepatospora eriocheir]|uniref:Uncharacterized protein n=1 Tax=Hepatospora eriocheir TaxID=1081669 RepID=A0A1X0QIE1_9MICR|nr:hypothetical protein A0H76_691 [Hepatospora eriocheir]
MILKSNEKFWNGKVKQAINAYNNCFHRVIQCTPNEAYENPCKIKCNGINEYADEIHCEEIPIGSTVLVAKHENIPKNQKLYSGRFVNEGKIIEKLNNGAYNVKIEDRIEKRMHYDCKKKLPVLTRGMSGIINILINFLPMKLIDIDI